MSQCLRPPAGWTCSRGADHEGPCAAARVRDTEEVRVLLIKKGDVLLIGNAGDLGDVDHEMLSRFTEVVGVHVALFEQDIVIGTAPVGALVVPQLPDPVTA